MKHWIILKNKQINNLNKTSIMSRIFVKKSDLALVNGGYLVTGKNETPVFNEKFISVQKQLS